MEPAVFRPVSHGQGKLIAAGAAGGALLGLLAGVPFLLAGLFGALAAAIAITARHAGGVRAVATAERLEVLGREWPFSGRWEELRLGFGRAARPDGGALQRFAILADPAGRSFAFGDFGGQGPCLPVLGADGRSVEVIDLREGALLLALVVQRMPAWHVLPAWLVEARPVEGTLQPVVAPAGAGASDPQAADAGPEAAAAQAVVGQAGRTPRMGLAALALKLGGKLVGSLGKLGAGALKAVKATNLGWAAASAAAYGILFRWEFAVALLLQLFVHEYGHVHAMRRTGMRVRGMYFIPFLGALAVTDDAFSSRRQQAYVALNGPLWGGLFSLLPLGLYLATGAHFWAAVAAWWALINLFNLLPITPLDGGRAMQAFAFSFSSSLGVAVAVLGLALAVLLGSVMGFSLIWLVALMGAVELVTESQARGGGRALRLLPDPARFGAPHLAYLRAVIGPPLGSPSEPAFARDLARMEQAARVAPMARRDLLRWGLLYAALAVGLLAIVYFTSHLPGAGEAAQILS